MCGLEHLFEPIRIAHIRVKNRLVMPAMSVNFGVDAEGNATEQLTAYLVARARGGTGMILVGGGAVHPSGLELPDLPHLWHDGGIPALRRLTESVKPHGAAIGMQLLHGGRQSYHDKKVAPSPIPAGAVVKGVPRELTRDEVREMVAAFGDSARRCRDSGFDFVEVHAAHGYLINQFMSPNSNKRKDEFGGSFENRIRFLLEIYEDIRRKAGPQLPVGIRINGEDFVEGGWTLEDALRLAPILEQVGAAYLSVSAGVYGSSKLTIPPMYEAQGCFVDLARAVKEVVSIPVVAVGRIKTPEHANRILRDGHSDLIAMGRAHLADPELANKARDGRIEEIRPCIGCCLGCIHQALALEPATCVVNPEVGREYRLETPHRVQTPRNVLVAGAGPSGLAVARMAALRGHRVRVVEEKGYSGGQARLAALVPGREEVLDIVRFLEQSLAKLEVDIRFKVGLDRAMVDADAVDAVILATGCLPEIPPIKGLNRTRMRVLTVVDVLESGLENGRKSLLHRGRTVGLNGSQEGVAASGSESVPEPPQAGREREQSELGDADDGETFGERVIVLGGNQAGLTVADYLAQRAREVVILNRQKHFGEEMASNDRYYLRERLKKAGVVLHKEVTIRKILADGVVFRVGQETVTLAGFDTLVLSEKMASIREGANMLRGWEGETHIVGDARAPRHHLLFCLADAEELGRTL